MFNLNLPAPFSYGYSFYTVIDIPGGFIYAAIQSENNADPQLWIFQVDMDNMLEIESYIFLTGDDLAPLRQMFTAAGLVEKLSATFQDGDEKISVFKSGDIVTLMKEDEHEYIDVPADAFDEFCRMLSVAEQLLNTEHSDHDTVN